ncbi:MAG: hypothetical protein EB145_18620 [Proteobacteria bacterium]|nr:hypothetical protein [Pseudomonadota bacterium]
MQLDPPARYGEAMPYVVPPVSFQIMVGDGSFITVVNEGLPDTDMASFAARYPGPIGGASIAKLDPARRYYFKIDNGPHVGDRCYDIQYSPIWEDVGG